MLQLEKINKYYPVGREKFHALKDISLTIEDGEFVSIEGESGAGKSTLLHILGLLDTFDSGSYQLDGKEVRQFNDATASAYRNQKIGFVMQDYSLIPGKTVLFNTMLPLLFGHRKERLSQVREKALSALQRVGIADQAKKKVSQLSGGQKQRVAIARALIGQPSMILADEPTGSLDTHTSAQIMDLLQAINQEDGITILVVTHSRRVSEYCHRKIVMSDGEIESDNIISQINGVSD